MKFYYNGQLVRTSKNHIYTHAVINTATGKAVGCRVGRDNAEAIIRSEISAREKDIATCRVAIKALEQGKSGYYEKYGRHTYYNKFRTSDTVEHYEEIIDRINENIGRINATWKVVELEAK